MVDSKLKAGPILGLEGQGIAPNSARRLVSTGKTLPNNTIMKPSSNNYVDGRGASDAENGITLSTK
jgi:hypothetical protein